MSTGSKRTRTRVAGVYRVSYPSGLVKYSATFRTPSGGQRTRLFPTYHQARAEKAKQEAAKVGGTFRDTNRDRTTVAAAMATRAGRPSKRPSTQARERSFIANHVEGTALGDTLLVRATHGDVQAWVNERARQMSGSTLRTGLKYVRATFNGAARTGAIPRSPISGRDLDVPSPDAKPVRALTIDEAAALVAATPRPLRAAIVLALGTGLRPGELLGLRVGDLVEVEVPAGRFVHVDHQLLRDGTLGPVKSKRNGKPVVRDVPLSADVCAALDDHLAFWGLGDPDEWLFSTGTGRPYSKQGFADVFARTVKRAKIHGRVTPHMLRHTYVSWMLHAGVSPVAVAELIGDRVETVLATYAHMLPESNDLAREAVDRALAGLSRCASVVAADDPARMVP